MAPLTAPEAGPTESAFPVYYYHKTTEIGAQTKGVFSLRSCRVSMWVVFVDPPFLPRYLVGRQGRRTRQPW